MEILEQTSELSSWPSSLSERSSLMSWTPGIVAEADTANVEAPGSADNSSAASSNSAVTESSVKNNPLF